MTHYKIISLVAFVGFTLNSCSNSNADSNPVDAKAANVAVEKIVLKRDTIETSLTIPGELIAYQQVDLYAKVTGFVRELKVDIGSKVSEGQVLLTLEAPELGAQLAAAQSRLKSQEALYTASLANYNRIAQTSKIPGTISQNDLDQAEAKKNADFANLEAARASYKEVNDISNYLVIRAPFSGTITARNINIGTYVGPSGKGSEFPALVLQQQDKLRLVISVPEASSGYLSKGDDVIFRVRTIPTESFQVKLVRFSGALDQRLRSQRVEADVNNSNGKLLAGTIADVSIPLTSSQDSFIVPKSAIVTSSEGVFVVKVVDGKAERVYVRKGIESNGEIEVFGELADNDALLKRATDEIKQGQSIQ